MPDAHKNFAYSTVATAPSPPTTGTSLVVAAGHGGRFPVVPFNATVWPSGAQPDVSNAEIVRVTAISTDTFTITRAQEGSTARGIVVGDQIAATITVKTLADVEALIPVVTHKQGSGAGDYTTTSTTDVDVDATNLGFTVTVASGKKMLIFVDAVVAHSISNNNVTVVLADGTTALKEQPIHPSGAGAGADGVSSFAYVFVGDGASHTFKMRWRTSAATATMRNSSTVRRPSMTFMEVPA